MQDALQQFFNQWRLTPIAQVAETGHAQVWKVEQTQGALAALKLYRRQDTGNEGPGICLLQHWQDRGAVTVIATSPSAVLMEWLDGPSLDQIARDGNPDRAMTMLAQTAIQLHAQPIPRLDDLVPLETVYAPFLKCRFAPDCPPELRKNMQRGKSLARTLLSTQHIRQPLHGDLHYGNVILDQNGLRVFDAKGYAGDPAFELANALRNPKELPDLVRRPAQINTGLIRFSQALQTSRKRLAEWAAAKCALSIFWRSNGPVSTDDEADLLDLLLHAADQ
ncbi:MAG: aminoglycoside phosphotransferase family protein [Pseudomonadota bacterium]